jgi:hypothetical protein
MKKNNLVLATMAMAAIAKTQKNELLDNSIPISNRYEIIGENRIYQTSPIYFPNKHTVDSYRGQQRKAKQRRKKR